jgi:hypothetical protein
LRLAAALRAGAFLIFRFTALFAIGLLSFCLSISLVVFESAPNKKMMRKFEDFVDSKLQIMRCQGTIQLNVLREILNFLVFRMLWMIIRTFRLHLRARVCTPDDASGDHSIFWQICFFSLNGAHQAALTTRRCRSSTAIM